MANVHVLSEWPVVRQVRAKDACGLGETAASDRARALLPRTVTADRVARSDLEGDLDSPATRSRRWSGA